MLSSSTAQVRKPRRWDVPFGEQMTPAEVQRLLRLELFERMDLDRFPPTCRLEDILLNDARVTQFEAGDIIVREGDYGNSVFIVLRGTVRVVVEKLPPTLLGRSQPDRQSLWRTLWESAFPSDIPEVRTYGHNSWNASIGQRQSGPSAHVFLQDVPGVLDQYRTLKLNPGEIFGEVAAMSRTPRTASVFAEGQVALLEIRWQGLRDMMRYDASFKERLNSLYRANSLESHLSETPFLKGLPHEIIHQIAQVTAFETHGAFEWHNQFERTKQEDVSQRIHAEPLICEEQTEVNGLVLIRSGFARMSRRYGDGHRTRAYLGKGQVFGLEELVFNARHGESMTWQNSLRAVGYVDVLRIPNREVEELILPHLDESELESLAQQAETFAADAKPHVAQHGLATGMMEFILDERVLNGTQTMLIDTNRCTRCDDCVQACAATHQGNPRFVREGPRYGQFMVAHACMHCADPVCMIGCPTGAIGREIATGAALINDRTCIGCSTCANSCPYDNIKMVEIRNAKGEFLRDEVTQQPIVKATKCDLCTGQWGGPACQRACPHDALVRIDLKDAARLSSWMTGG